VPTIPPGSIVRSSSALYWLVRILGVVLLPFLLAAILQLVTSDLETRTRVEWLGLSIYFLLIGSAIFVALKRFAVVTCDDLGIDIERSGRTERTKWSDVASFRLIPFSVPAVYRLSFTKDVLPVYFAVLPLGSSSPLEWWGVTHFEYYVWDRLAGHNAPANRK
jgi:hypothetical protein